MFWLSFIAMNTSSSLRCTAANCLPRSAARPRRPRGFTLVELVTVLAVASILLSAAVPSLLGLVRSVQLTSASNDFLAGLLMARSEAVKRNGRAVLCKSADGISCAATGGWEQGWLVFSDSNNNGQRDPGETILQHARGGESELRVTGNQNVSRYVSYAPDGTSKMVSGAFQAGTVTLCRQSAGEVEARQIVLSSAGRPRVQKAKVASCG